MNTIVEVITHAGLLIVVFIYVTRRCSFLDTGFREVLVTDMTFNET